jgi:hypothetical protein
VLCSGVWAGGLPCLRVGGRLARRRKEVRTHGLCQVLVWGVGGSWHTLPWSSAHCTVVHALSKNDRCLTSSSLDAATPRELDTGSGTTWEVDGNTITQCTTSGKPIPDAAYSFGALCPHLAVVYCLVSLAKKTLLDFFASNMSICWLDLHTSSKRQSQKRSHHCQHRCSTCLCPPNHATDRLTVKGQTSSC